MMAVALLCGAAMVSCTEKLEEMPEAKSTVASPDNTSTTPDNQTYGEWYYVPLEELLTGEWELATDTIGWIDIDKWGAFLRAIGVTGYLTADNAYTLSELPWQGLINTIGGFTSREHPILKVNMTFENGIMHIDREQYQYTYDENDNLIGFDSIPLPIQTDFTIDIENECRIRFTPIDPAQWYPTHNQNYENKLVICSLDSNRFVTVYDNYFGSREGIPTVSLYRRVR